MASEIATLPIRPDTCPMCRRAVIWGRIEQGGGRVTLVPIETCAEGRGNVALSPGMFAAPGELLFVSVVSNGTRYRMHRQHCTGTAAGAPPFSAVAFNRKAKG